MTKKRDGKPVVPGRGGYDIEFVEVTGPPDSMKTMPLAKSRGKLIPLGTGEGVPEGVPQRPAPSAMIDFNSRLPPARTNDAPFKGPQAIVVSDLVGYTRRAQDMILSGIQLGDDGVYFVEQLDEIIKQQLKGAFADLNRHDSWEDHLIASTGDGVIVRFDSVTDALAYGLAIHKRATIFNDANKPNVPFQHRVGIAWGTILLRNEWVGSPFIVAARMNGASMPGSIAIENEAWQGLAQEASKTNQPLPGDFVEYKDLPGKAGEQPYHGWVRAGVARCSNPVIA